MVTTPSTTTARALAEQIDKAHADDRSGSAVLAIQAGVGAVPQVTRVAGNPMIALASRAPSPCVCACLSVTVFATDLNKPEQGRRRLRLTLAIECCTTEVLIRDSGGRTVRGAQCDGELLDAIRGAVVLARCRSCDAEEVARRASVTG